jgi:hypothetical protein
MFGLGLLKGTAIGLTGGIVIGLAINEACKKIKNKKNKTISNNSSTDDTGVNTVDES